MRRAAAPRALVVRRARRRDAVVIARMARALNVHEGDPTKYLDVAAIRRDWFGRRPACVVLIAALGKRPVGYVTLTPAYESGWALRGFYLADLYVAPHARRHGVGRALVVACAKLARRRGGGFLWCASRLPNRRARAFYRRLGAIAEPVIAHALLPDALDRLLGSADSERRPRP